MVKGKILIHLMITHVCSTQPPVKLTMQPPHPKATTHAPPLMRPLPRVPLLPLPRPPLLPLSCLTRLPTMLQTVPPKVWASYQRRPLSHLPSPLPPRPVLPPESSLTASPAKAITTQAPPSVSLLAGVWASLQIGMSTIGSTRTTSATNLLSNQAQRFPIGQWGQRLVRGALPQLARSANRLPCC
jgi:hypothetical protein